MQHEGLINVIQHRKDCVVHLQLHIQEKLYYKLVSVVVNTQGAFSPHITCNFSTKKSSKVKIHILLAKIKITHFSLV